MWYNSEIEKEKNTGKSYQKLLLSEAQVWDENFSMTQACQGKTTARALSIPDLRLRQQTHCNIHFCPVIHCNTNLPSATHCNTHISRLQPHCNTHFAYATILQLIFSRLNHTATHISLCNTLQHTFLPCNTLQHTSRLCNTLQHTLRVCNHTATHILPLQQLCNTRVFAATHVFDLQHTATHVFDLQHTATHCNTLQHTATHCNTLQQTATHCNTRV